MDPDSDVLDLVASRDMKAAVRHLMERHGDAVYRYCRTALRDDTLAEDVQQQVFVQVLRDLPRFKRRSTVRTWLFSITRNRVLDAIKARGRRAARLDGEVSPDLVDPARLPGESLDDARLRQALDHCLSQLAESIRLAVLLRFQQDFTYEEMALVFGEKPGTLQAKVKRAFPALRDCIEGRIGFAGAPQ